MTDITRLGQPNQYDHAKFGTRCRVFTSPERFELWVQISHAEEHPNWQFISKFNCDVKEKDIDLMIDRLPFW